MLRSALPPALRILGTTIHPHLRLHTHHKQGPQGVTPAKVLAPQFLRTGFQHRPSEALLVGRQGPA